MLLTLDTDSIGWLFDTMQMMTCHIRRGGIKKWWLFSPAPVLLRLGHLHHTYKRQLSTGDFNFVDPEHLHF